MFDARTGVLRQRFNPEVPVIVDALSPEGARTYARNWPPSDLTAERLVIDATNGRILEREPRFSLPRRLDPSTLRVLAERLFDTYRESFMLATP